MMIKYSIIIPVYNVEKYIDKCINSVLNQTYDNYEIIVVNDGSKDNSEKKLEKYKNNCKIKIYKKKNGGLSDARNFGLKYVTGDYILFLDSDDYYNNELLEKLTKRIKEKKYDVIKFKLNLVNEEYNICSTPMIKSFNNLNISKSIKSIITDEIVDCSCIYAYNSSFWKKNKFNFEKGRFHEDFGLTPIILSKCESISCIDYIGYNYLQRDNSIMSFENYNKTKKKVDDFKYLHELHNKIIECNCKKNKEIIGYSAISFIYKTRELNNEDRDEYISYIKKNKIIKKINNSSFKRFLIKNYMKINIKKYLEKKSKEYYRN